MPQHPGTTTVYFCLGQSYVLPSGQRIWSDGIHLDTLNGVVSVFDLRYSNPRLPDIHETICSNESIFFDGAYRSRTGRYFARVSDDHYCDTIVVLYLTVIYAVKIEISQEKSEICASDTEIRFRYKMLSGDIPIFYEIEFCATGKDVNLRDTTGVITSNEGVIEIDMPVDVLPGTYFANIIFFQPNELCGNDTVPLRIEIRYSSEILVQKWNNVIAIRDKGVEFSDFLWHKNGEPLHGETRPYLYMRGNAELAFGIGYSVLLTRASDGVSVLTCEYFPTWRPIPFATANLFPTVLQANETATLSLPQSADVFIYDIMGIRQSYMRIQDGGEHSLFVSNRSGYYIVRVLQGNRQQQNFRVLVR